MSEGDIDLSGFASAVNSYADATGKDMVAVVNRAGRNVAYRAAQFTGTTSAAKIRAELRGNPRMTAALTRLSLNRRGVGKLSKQDFAAEVEKFIERRASSSRYLRFGWAQAIVDMGGNYRGAKLARGSHGFGEKATVVDLLAQIAWILDEPTDDKANTAENEAFPALQEALDFVTADMLKYAAERMAKTAADHSA